MNSAQLTALYQRYFKPLRKTLRDRCSIATAEVDDLAQEVFLRLLRYPDSEIRANPAGYIFKIGSNIAYEWRLRKKNSAARSSEWLEELVLATDLEPQNLFEVEERDRELQRAIDQLPPRCQTALLLHVKQELTYHQIAQEMGISDSAVIKHLTKAYAKLRRDIFK